MGSVIQIKDQNSLVKCSEYKHAKWQHENFNPVQSRVFEICHEDANTLVAAKTSAGKTVIAEMFIAQEIRQRGGKGMFLAPLKALAQEKIDQWTDPDYHFGDLKVSICTGDYRLTSKRQDELNAADLIIMTSEMLNHRSRNIDSEKSAYLKQIKTLVIDESHLLTVPGRGEHLEVGLMKFTQINPECRIVLLSATMPNVGEIAEWLSTLNGKNTYVLNSEYRPVPLGIHYENYDDDAYTYEAVERNKIEKAMDIIRDYPDDKFLVFAHTKRTGDLMTQILRANSIPSEFHNADLDKDSRVDLERRFKNDKEFRVVVATPTLAWGVNMPARRVIILGVHRGKDEVETYNVTQMIGRSGRLGIDPRGDAYILLPNGDAKRHRDRLNSPQTITSKLLEKHRNLAFHIVSEIHHGHISKAKDVKTWFERSLAYFQNRSLSDLHVKDILDEMLKREVVYELEDNTLEVSSVGKISSIFYYNPFDVADLRRNFYFLFQQGKQDSDVHASAALARTESNRMMIVSSAEKQEMRSFDMKLQREFGADYKFLTEGLKKTTYGYYCLMNGATSQIMSGYQRNLQTDFERVEQILLAIDSMSGKWGRESYFRDLAKRVRHGVPLHMVDLCSLPNVGKARAKKLYDLGYKNPKAVASLDEASIRKILNVKQELAAEIRRAALSSSSPKPSDLIG